MPSLKALKKKKKQCLLPKIQQWAHFSKIWKGVERTMACVYLKGKRSSDKIFLVQIAYLTEILITVFKNRLFP